MMITLQILGFVQVLCILIKESKSFRWNLRQPMAYFPPPNYNSLYYYYRPRQFDYYQFPGGYYRNIPNFTPYPLLPYVDIDTGQQQFADGAFLYPNQLTDIMYPNSDVDDMQYLPEIPTARMMIPEEQRMISLVNGIRSESKEPIGSEDAQRSSKSLFSMEWGKNRGAGAMAGKYAGMLAGVGSFTDCLPGTIGVGVGASLSSKRLGKFLTGFGIAGANAGKDAGKDIGLAAGVGSGANVGCFQNLFPTLGPIDGSAAGIGSGNGMGYSVGRGVKRRKKGGAKSIRMWYEGDEYYDTGRRDYYPVYDDEENAQTRDMTNNEMWMDYYN